MKHNARDLRKSGVLSEALLWKHLKNRQLNGYLINRQKVIDCYIVDFYCAENKTIIEVDGSTHDFKESYDKMRDEYFKSRTLI